MEQRPYFAYAFYDLQRWRILFLLPLVRVGASLLQGGTPQLYRYELLLTLLLISYAGMKWYCCRYRLSTAANGQFCTVGVRQGIIVRRTLHVSADEAASVEVERTPLLWLFRGRRVLVSTAGLRRRADAKLYVSAKQARRLFPLEQRQLDYRAPRWPIIVLSLTGSNAAVGLLTIAPLLRQGGTVLGEQVAQGVIGLVDGWITPELPLALRAAGNVLLIGWGVSAVRIFLRYVGFRAHRSESHIHVSSGLFTHRDVFIDRDKITALELRQTLTMRLFSLYTAVVTAAGYGRDLGTRPVLIPAAHSRELGASLERLLPEFPVGDCRLRPARGSVWRYIGLPLLFLLCDVGLWLLGRWWHGAAVVGLTVGLWWLLVRLLGFGQAGFGYDNGCFTMYYSRGLALYRVYLPQEVTDCVVVTRSCLQRRQGTCSVKVRCFGEKKRTHRVWGLPYDGLLRELERWKAKK